MPISRRTLLRGLLAVPATGLAGCTLRSQHTLPGTLTLEWASDTRTTYTQNHHALAVASVDGEPVIGVPLNDRRNEGNCGLVALSRDGTVRWRHDLPPAECTVHAVGHLGAGSLPPDATNGFLVATETGRLLAFNAASGDPRFQADLPDWVGFSPPTTGRLTHPDALDIVAVDLGGTVTVFQANGTPGWQRDAGGIVWAPPIVTDLTGNDTPDIAVAYGGPDNGAVVYDAAGNEIWRAEFPDFAPGWSAIPTDQGVDLVLPTRAGTVVRLAGPTGEVVWQTDLPIRRIEATATDHGVYVTGAGRAWRLRLDDGEPEWDARVTDDEVRLSSPTAGRFATDPPVTIAVTAFDGTIAVIDAATGRMLARTTTDEAIYTPPVAADVTRDGRDNLIVFHGNGIVNALSYHPRDA